jgi:hypothetical protein
MLVQFIIDSGWARLRYSRIEAGVLRFLLSDDIDPELFADASNRIVETLCRYGTTKERALSRAMHDLERLQDRRTREVSRPTPERLVLTTDRTRTIEALFGKPAGEHPPKQVAMEKTKADPVGNGGSVPVRASKIPHAEAMKKLE